MINFAWRLGPGAEAAIRPWGLVLSLIVVCILVFTGWKGWEMVYRHRVAVLDAPGQSGSTRGADSPSGGSGHRHAA